MKILKICSNAKIINLVAAFEVFIFAILHVLGSATAKYYLIAWMLWLIVLTVSRFHYFGTHRFCNNH